MVKAREYLHQKNLLFLFLICSSEPFSAFQQQRIFWFRAPTSQPKSVGDWRTVTPNENCIRWKIKQKDPTTLTMSQIITSLNASDGDLVALDKDNNNSCFRSKRGLLQAYRIGKYMFATVAMLLLCMPDRTMSSLLAKKMAGAAGFGVASGLFYILGGACEHNRLNSDTYKRLNLGLLGFCLIGLAAVPGESAFLTETSLVMGLTAILSLLKIYGAVVSVVGWKQGVATTTLVGYRKELGQGILSMLKGMKVTDAKKALTYRNCLLLVSMGILSSLMEGFFYMRYKTALHRTFTWFEISLQWSAVSRLCMLASMIFSLKDAAERDRLKGTTFIQMNCLIGMWAVFTGLGQTITPRGFLAQRGMAMFAFAILFFIKALKSQIQKSAEDKEK